MLRDEHRLQVITLKKRVQVTILHVESFKNMCIHSACSFALALQMHVLEAFLSNLFMEISDISFSHYCVIHSLMCSATTFLLKKIINKLQGLSGSQIS